MYEQKSSYLSGVNGGLTEGRGSNVTLLGEHTFLSHYHHHHLRA